MRKLATAAAVSLALASGGAFGLGLGDIDMRSALNQPMNAEIPLTSVKAGELDGMIVTLADEDAFARAGIERSTVLTELEFSVDGSGPNPVIRVTSPRAVTEPFLNFLLEVDWPQGRMVREYTVLLDPPVFMTQGPSVRDDGADRAPVAGGDSAIVAPAPIERNATTDGFDVELVEAGDEVADDALLGGTDSAAVGGDVVSLDGLVGGAADDGGEVVSLTDLGAPNTAAAAEREARAAASDELFDVELVGDGVEVGDDAGADDTAVASADAGGDVVSLDDLGTSSGGTGSREVTVERGDTLFAIAEREAPSGVSVEQTMLALLEANRSAFINDNINLVRAGSILRVPQAAEARALSQAQALAEIGRQSDLWRQYRDNLRGTTAGTQIARGPSDVGAADTGTDVDANALADAEAGLSENARAILEAAREEVRRRDELSIVADDTTAVTTASATADETEGGDSARLGEVNRMLQLAREELAATRVEGRDLGEQAEELQSTSENLDALVSLRQNEIAKLEAQLADARDAASGTADDAAGEAGEVASDAANTAGDVVGDAGTAVADAGEAAAGAAAAAGEAAGEAAGAAADATADAASATADAAGATVDAAGDAVEGGVADVENALSAAGTELESVELVGAGTDADGSAGDPAVLGASNGDTAATAAAAADGPWYQNLFSDPTRLAIVGAGALGLLGLLGTLLWRRRRQDDDDPLAGFHDEDVEFIDDEEAARLQDEVDAQTSMARGAVATDAGVDAAGTRDGFGDTSAVAAAGVAGAAAAGAAAFGANDESADAADGESLDKDDTISEVDVYLAYGLHGQAEELLTKAIDRQPENMEYAEKLLQTYHAQGNGEGFQRAASDYHARFGGDDNPAWPGIAAMGRELRPDEALFSDTVGASSDGGHVERTAFGDEDFLPASEGMTGSSSVTRDFGSSEDALDFDSTDDIGSFLDEGDRTSVTSGSPSEELDDLEDESALMDQSLDPAFAFDEGDLEATGDFSQIAGELAAEGDDDGSLDFPGFETGAGTGSGEKSAEGAGAGAALAAGAAAIAGAAGLAAGAGTNATSGSDGDEGVFGAGEETATDQPPLGELTDGHSLDDAMTLDELDLDGTSSIAANDTRAVDDDLSLDLDDLASSIDLDATSVDGTDFLDEVELVEGGTGGLSLDTTDLDGLDMTELESEGDFMNGTAAPLDGSDEMDTMMDLAKAYIDMGDKDSASNALGEIVKGGNPEQVSEAETLLGKIS